MFRLISRYGFWSCGLDSRCPLPVVRSQVLLAGAGSITHVCGGGMSFGPAGSMITFDCAGDDPYVRLTTP